MTDFDLLIEPWIPVILANGSRVDMSVGDCLALAPSISEIAEASPLVTFGVYRFLGAVVQAYMPLPDLDAWADAWERATFSTEALTEVNDRLVGKLRLFHATRPFYQSGDIVETATPKSQLKTVGYLYPEASTGTNVTHFSHAGDASHAYCPGCCAMALIALPPFATSGGSGIKPSINGVPPIYVLPTGMNLFETLLLNDLVPMFQPDQRAPLDPGPLWDQDGIIAANVERTSVGFIESLTWSPRTVRLFPSTGGTCSRCGRTASVLVRTMVYGQGLSRPRDLPTWDDPWVSFWETDTNGKVDRKPVRPHKLKDIWRDFSTLFLTHPEVPTKGGRRSLRPTVLRQIDRLVSEETLSGIAPIRFDAFGFRTDGKMKYFEWRHDTFVFPLVLLHGDAAWVADEAVGVAEFIDRRLTSALWQLHPKSQRVKPGRDESRAPITGMSEEATRAYWRDLEQIFREKLSDPDLAGPKATQAQWLRRWKDDVARVAQQIFEEVLSSFDDDADGLRAQVRARGVLDGALKKMQEGRVGDNPDILTSAEPRRPTRKATSVKKKGR